MNRSTRPVRMRDLLFFALSLWASFVVTAPARATERGSWEIGMDAGAEFTTRTIEVFSFVTPAGGFITEHESMVEVPQATLRAGYFLTEALSIEPSFGFSTLLIDRPAGQVATGSARVGIVGTYALAPRATASPYIGTGASISSVLGGLSDVPFFPGVRTRFGVPLEVGVRIRAGQSGLLRIQSGAIARFDDYAKTAWTIPIQLGWSWVVEPAPGGSR